jgi:hypothetical protein
MNAGCIYRFNSNDSVGNTFMAPRKLLNNTAPGQPTQYHRVNTLILTKDICQENHSGKLHGRTAGCFRLGELLEVEGTFSIGASTGGLLLYTE